MNDILKRKSTLVLALCLGALVSAGTLQARGQGRHHSPEQRFQDLDTDGSGSVTVTEIEAGILGRFAKRTQRQQERKTKQEARWKEKGLSEEQIAEKKAEIQARRERWKAKSLEPSEDAEKSGRRGRGHRGLRLDTDGDGAVSAAEISAAAAKRLELLDTDKDGSVSKEEFASAGHGKRGKHGRHGKRRHRGHRDHICPESPALPESGEG